MKDLILLMAAFLHDLFTVIWMGGLIVVVLSFLPAVKETLGKGPQTKQVMKAFQKKQGKWVYISMIGLILTGMMLSKQSQNFVHLFNFNTQYGTILSIKHILVIVMIGITLVRSLVLTRNEPSPRKEKMSFLFIVINAILAVLVLFTSAWLTVL